MLSQDDIELMHKALELFGQLFKDLLLASILSQKKLSEEATRLRDEFVSKRQMVPGDPLVGGMTQQTISKVTTGQRPTPGQLRIWLDIVKDWINNPAIRAELIKNNLPIPDLNEEFERALWRLALYGTIDEIEGAYKAWKDVDLLEGRPPVQHHSTYNLPLIKQKMEQETDTNLLRITDGHIRQVRKPELQH
jgi:hypothetical protein